jgi:AcrR family transcriptional regulator
MPRTEAANQRVREEQRARILERALAVFARKGLAATMADVAAEAGVSQGLAYRYFSNKDELFRALVEDAMRTGAAEQPTELGAGTPWERLSVLLTRLIESRREHPEFFQLLHHVASDPGTPADLHRLMARRARGFVDLLRGLVVEGQATGEVAADDPDQLVSAVVAFVDGLGRLQSDHPGGSAARYPSPEIALRMLRAPVEAPR